MVLTISDRNQYSTGFMVRRQTILELVSGSVGPSVSTQMSKQAEAEVVQSSSLVEVEVEAGVEVEVEIGVEVEATFTGGWVVWRSEN